ncbi:hypothetical protein [Streptomyces tubercidicus]
MDGRPGERGEPSAAGGDGGAGQELGTTVAEFADVVLPVRVEAPSPFDSIVAPVAVAETLVAAVHVRLGAAAEERVRAAEEASGDRTVE